MSDIECTACGKSLEECMAGDASCGFAARTSQRLHEAEQRERARERSGHSVSGASPTNEACPRCHGSGLGPSHVVGEGEMMSISVPNCATCSGIGRVPSAPRASEGIAAGTRVRVRPLGRIESKLHGREGVVRQVDDKDRDDDGQRDLVEVVIEGEGACWFMSDALEPIAKRTNEAPSACIVNGRNGERIHHPCTRGTPGCTAAEHMPTVDNLCTWCRKPMAGHPMMSCVGEIEPGSVADDVLKLAHAFSDVGRKDGVRALAHRVRRLEESAQRVDKAEAVVDMLGTRYDGIVLLQGLNAIKEHSHDEWSRDAAKLAIEGARIVGERVVAARGEDVSPARLLEIASNAGGSRATRDEQRWMARELIAKRSDYVHAVDDCIAEVEEQARIEGERCPNFYRPEIGAVMRAVLRLKALRGKRSDSPRAAAVAWAKAGPEEPEDGVLAGVTLDSPPFRPAALDELAARGYERVNAPGLAIHTHASEPDPETVARAVETALRDIDREARSGGGLIEAGEALSRVGRIVKSALDLLESTETRTETPEADR